MQNGRLKTDENFSYNADFPTCFERYLKLTIVGKHEPELFSKYIIKTNIIVNIKCLDLNIIK